MGSEILPSVFTETSADVRSLDHIDSNERSEGLVSCKAHNLETCIRLLSSHPGTECTRKLSNVVIK